MALRLNTWASAESPFVFHVATKVDAFLESTGPMTTLMNVIIHAVAGALLDVSANVLEQAQFTDQDSGLFAMRTRFGNSGNNARSINLF